MNALSYESIQRRCPYWGPALPCFEREQRQERGAFPVVEWEELAFEPEQKIIKGTRVQRCWLFQVSNK